MSNKPPIVFLGPQWFAPVMGWCGVALAWHRAGAALGEPAHAVSLASGAVALAVFAVVLAASALRALRFPAALAEDLAHPVRHAFAAALPVSVVLLATVGHAAGAPHALVLATWAAGIALQLLVTTWIVTRWFAGRLQWPTMTPVVYIPIVGNILVPLAGVPLGYPLLSWCFFGIGAFFWPVVTALMLARVAQHPLPDRLAPSWFITIAPPAVGGSAALSLGAPDGIAAAALGIATLCALAAATRAPGIAKAPFAMPAWATSFPLAAYAALTLRMGAHSPAVAAAGVLLLAVASVVVLGLTLATIRGLRAGTLLAPEPVATVVAAP